MTQKQVFDRVVLPGGLYLVSTPIGAARDITLRALDVLASADVIAAEDTRTLRHLMDLHGIPLGERKVLPYHDHNGAAQRPRLLAALREGQSIAYASDAGTPLIADPGFRLARDAAEAGYRVHVAPGPSAAIAALTLSGLPSDRFLFAGFPPSSGAARRKFLQGLAGIEATLILFESPKRIEAALRDMIAAFGADRSIALCREITKKFEEVRRGTLLEVSESVQASRPKGEIVLVIGPAEEVALDAETLDTRLREALERLSVKDAVTFVAQTANIPKREVYQRALELTSSRHGKAPPQ